MTWSNLAILLNITIVICVNHCDFIILFLLLSPVRLPFFHLIFQDVQQSSSLLYFWYAEVEIAHNSSQSSDSRLRAIYILSCLGNGARYSPFTAQPSSVQILRARQGFKDRIKLLSSTWARGIVEDHSCAVICSAALFEELTSGWAPALEILEHSFTMVLPGE